jgi:hypothetical protein
MADIERPGLFDQMHEVVGEFHSQAGRRLTRQATKGLVLVSARLCECGYVHNHCSVMDPSTRRLVTVRLADCSLAKAGPEGGDTPAGLAVAVHNAAWEFVMDRLS